MPSALNQTSIYAHIQHHKVTQLFLLDHIKMFFWPIIHNVCFIMMTPKILNKHRQLHLEGTAVHLFVSELPKPKIPLKIENAFETLTDNICFSLEFVEEMGSRKTKASILLG